MTKNSQPDLHKRITQLEKELRAATRKQADTAAIKEAIGSLGERVSSLQLPKWLSSDSVTAALNTKVKRGKST